MSRSLLWTLAGFAARGFFEDSSPERKIVPLEHPVCKPGISRNPAEETARSIAHTIRDEIMKQKIASIVPCPMRKSPALTLGSRNALQRRGAASTRTPSELGVFLGGDPVSHVAWTAACPPP